MDAQTFWILAHVLLFVYWLGADIGLLCEKWVYGVVCIVKIAPFLFRVNGKERAVGE